MFQKSFAQDYEFQQPIENIDKSIQQPSKKFLVFKKNVQGKKEIFISVHFPTNIDFGDFKKLRSLKYISILQPEAYYDENEYILIYLNYHDHRLNQKRLQEYKDQEFQRIQDKNTKQEKRVTHANRIVLQLALLFAELEKRQYKWPLEQIEQLSYINGLLYITLADYDFNSQKVQNTCFQQFINFIHKYFPEELVKIQQKTLSEVVKCLCREYITSYNHSGDNDTSYENVLKHLLQVDQFKKINDINANSDVKEFKIPDILLDLHPQLSNLEKKCVYKATKMIDNEEEKEIILKRMDREIEIMEANNSQLITLCSVYFRILDTPYLIMKKYPTTLQKILHDQKPSDENLKQYVYTFSYKFAKALKDLHRLNVIHRDLKPDNIFLNNSEFLESDVIIGDLDRSKKKNDKKSIENTIDQTVENQDNHRMYNPPEKYVDKQKNYSYDVFQYGIIISQLANRGKFFNPTGPRDAAFDGKFDQYYGSKAIQDTLSQYNYDREFINLMIDCLKQNPKERPHSESILQRTQNLFQQQQQIEANRLIQQTEIQTQSGPEINQQDQDLVNKIKMLQKLLENHFDKQNLNS